MTRWGKAGERLTDDEAARRARAHNSGKNATAAAQAAAEAEGRRGWEAGLVTPWRITHALDMRELYGPEVDKACGVEEPAVDHWELGILYPRWKQFTALAELTGFAVDWFSLPGDPIRVEETSMWWHLKPSERAAIDDRIVLRFQPGAITDTLRAEGVLRQASARRPCREQRATALPSRRQRPTSNNQPAQPETRSESAQMEQTEGDLDATQTYVENGAPIAGGRWHILSDDSVIYERPTGEREPSVITAELLRTSPTWTRQPTA
ncbi:hypothetical protein ACQP2U_42520 (plasmid) [Nocardia sp. CA-084685]|uniref:hypothetical protein n=1 Tax=Nocardia sp. CA-084685 TaxID=3239970 RepID=UPI003D97B533